MKTLFLAIIFHQEILFILPLTHYLIQGGSYSFQMCKFIFIFHIIFFVAFTFTSFLTVFICLGDKDTTPKGICFAGVTIAINIFSQRFNANYFYSAQG